MPGGKHSIVQYLGGDSGHRCGYCGSSDTNLSKGMWAHSLTIDDYELMLNRNIRRSGCYCYKPSMKETCCPMYMIRCDAANFKPSKSQKKVLKRMHCFLATGEGADQMTVDSIEPLQDSGCDTSAASKSVSSEAVATPTSSAQDATSSAMRKELSSNKSGQKGTTTNKDTTPLTSEGASLSKPRGKQPKAKELRRARWREKQLAKGESVEVKKKVSSEKLLDDFFNAPLREPSAHKLEVRFVQSHPRSKLFQETIKESQAVYHRYQVKIHGDKECEADMKQFQRFLVDSPLHSEAMPEIEDLSYGSYHIQYVLDGRIIAVEVVDVLHHCVSSKYFYYEPTYHFLSMGTYSALRSIWHIQQWQKAVSQLKYYVMGYFIQSCPKMVYKGNFYGSSLLCPESYEWVPIEQCRPKLASSKYSRLDETDKADPDAAVNLARVLVLFEHEIMPFGAYSVVAGLRKNSDSEQETGEYSLLVGRRLSSSLLLYRQ